MYSIFNKVLSEARLMTVRKDEGESSSSSDKGKIKIYDKELGSNVIQYQDDSLDNLNSKKARK